MKLISKIPTQELANDYYESLIEAKACEKLALSASTEAGRQRLEERAVTNRQIMRIIAQELTRRGEVSALGPHDPEKRESIMTPVLGGNPD